MAPVFLLCSLSMKRPLLSVQYLRLEGLLTLLTALYFYHFFQGNWRLFVILLFVPDVSMIGYSMNPTIGARMYNIAHSYALPIILLLLGWHFQIKPCFFVSLIWIAHIGLDRSLGYGLKEDANFKETHLGRIGKQR